MSDNDINNPMSEMMMREMVTDTITLHNAFVNETPSYVKGLTEDEFKVNVLPYIVGRIEVPKEHAVSFFNYLVDRAGSETAPIPVYGSNREVLFKMPALLNTNAVHAGDFTSKGSITLATENARLEQMSVLANRAMNYALNSPNSPIKILDKDQAKSELEQFFDLLEKRYGKEGMRVNKTTSSQTAVLAANEDDDLLDI